MARIRNQGHISLIGYTVTEGTMRDNVFMFNLSHPFKQGFTFCLNHGPAMQEWVSVLRRASHDEPEPEPEPERSYSTSDFDFHIALLNFIFKH